MKKYFNMKELFFITSLSLGSRLIKEKNKTSSNAYLALWNIQHSINDNVSIVTIVMDSYGYYISHQEICSEMMRLKSDFNYLENIDFNFIIKDRDDLDFYIENGKVILK